MWDEVKEVKEVEEVKEEERSAMLVRSRFSFTSLDSLLFAS